jgi:hypothetical protein
MQEGLRFGVLTPGLSCPETILFRDFYLQAGRFQKGSLTLPRKRLRQGLINPTNIFGAP